MEHVKHDLGQLRKGSTVVVQLGNQANVLLMDASNYRTYASGRGGQFRYFGGLQTRSPARLPVPNDGHWYVAIDLGGYAGQIRSGVAVEPPPAGFLPPMRDAESLTQIRRNMAATPPPDVLGRQIHDVFVSHASEDKETVAGEQNLLPIWHNVTKDDVLRYSPSLADKLARSTATHTIDEIAREIAAVVRS